MGTNDTYYDGHEFYHHAKFGEDRRCENVVFVFFYRQDAAKRQTGIKFSHRPKIRVFATHGRLVAPIQVKLCTADGHVRPLGCAKFHLNRCRGMGMRPQKYQKFPLLVKSRHAGTTPLTAFETFRGFYTSNSRTLLFQISLDSLHRLRSYCWETARL